MENRRNGHFYHRNYHRWNCRRLFQQWQLCLILFGCSSPATHMRTQDYTTSCLRQILGDKELGLTLEIVKFDDQVHYFLIPNSGTFTTPDILIDNTLFSCNLLRGGEKLLLTDSATQYLLNRDSPTIKTDFCHADKINKLEQIAKIPFTFPNVVLDLES